MKTAGYGSFHIRGVRKLRKIKWTKIGLVLGLLVLLSGCFSTSWVVSLKSDGSGIVEMDYRIDRQVMGMMMSMGGEGAEAEMPQSSADLFDEAEMHDLAAALGPGVRFVSAEPIDDDSGFFRYTALFAFDDINELSIDPMEGGPQSEDEGGAAPYRFLFTPGGTAELKILVEQDEEEEEEVEEWGEYDEEPSTEEQQAMGEMMKPYFQSMAFLVQVKIDGRIVETNASHVDGNIITLLDMDMGKIVDNDELFQEMLESPNMQDDEMVEKLSKAGIRVESREEVSVRFR